MKPIDFTFKGQTTKELKEKAIEFKKNHSTTQAAHLK
jgi:hypothetical protein